MPDLIQQFLQKSILTMAAFNPPLLFDRLYDLSWYRGILQEWTGGLSLANGAKVLELGCGPGRLSTDLSKAGFAVTGVDKSLRMIRRAGQLTTPAEIVCADAFNLPFDEAAFDAVLLASLINIVPDRKKLLAEVGRVLAPGGTVSVLFPTPRFNAAMAERLGTQQNLSAFSAAAMSVWANVGKKLEPEEMGLEYSQSGFENPTVQLYLEKSIASVTATRGDLPARPDAMTPEGSRTTKGAIYSPSVQPACLQAVRWN